MFEILMLILFLGAVCSQLLPQGCGNKSGVPRGHSNFDAEIEEVRRDDHG